MSLVPVVDGRCLVWVATCVDTLCVSHITSTLISPGAAATNAKAAKLKLIIRIFWHDDFRPVGFDTFRPAGEEAKNSKFIGKRLKALTGENRSEQFLWQRFSIEVQRDNSIAILGTVPYSRGLDEILYVLHPTTVF